MGDAGRIGIPFFCPVKNATSPFQLDFFQPFSLPVLNAPGPARALEPARVLSAAELNSYDRVVITMSGGKDSLATALHVLEAGVDLHRVEFWHHLVDGPDGNLMDWPSTSAYCQAAADALGVPLYLSWKQGGFEGEMLRENSLTRPNSFEMPLPDGTRTIVTTGGTGGNRSTRRMFPQVSADLSIRYCSSYLKIDVARTALRNQDRFNFARTLVVSGERAQESPGRAGYAMFEPDDTDARDSPRLRRHIDRYRPVHRWSEAQVWEIMERWRVNPHPAYRLGWSRCSCAGCIFNGANEFATLRQINPIQFAKLSGYEKEFGRTIKRKLSLPAVADAGRPFFYAEADAIAALSTTFAEPFYLPKGNWQLPSGAFRQGGGPI